jgi:putative phosphoribosyl transferase
VPIGAATTCAELGEIADECICAIRPEHFRAVGLWYDDFAQTEDDEVGALLARAAAASGSGSDSSTDDSTSSTTQPPLRRPEDPP